MLLLVGSLHVLQLPYVQRLNTMQCSMWFTRLAVTQ